ncbi:MAG TPA: hypothetical protein ENJ18_02915 [Nannocystis exedens]|nr:hypothetical protein [Nannocystis exedens]
MQQELVFKALAVATGGVLSFGSILLVIVLLSSKGGLKKASAYVAGYGGTYLLVGLVWFAALGQGGVLADDPSGQGQVVGWAKLALGLLLLGIGVRTWQKGPDPEAEPGSAMLQKLDAMSWPGLFGAGVLIVVVNVKNAAVFLSALSLLAQAKLEIVARTVALSALVAVFSGVLVLPIVLVVLFRRRAMPWLQASRRWIEGSMRPLSIAVALLFGALFVGSALSTMWVL